MNDNDRNRLCFDRLCDLRTRIDAYLAGAVRYDHLADYDHALFMIGERAAQYADGLFSDDYLDQQ